MKEPGYYHHKARNLAKTIVDGKTIYLGPYGSPESHAEYEKAVERWRRKHGQQAKPKLPTKVETVTQLLAHWHKHAEKRYVNEDGTPSKEQKNFRIACTPLARLFGTLPIEDFTPKKLKAYQLALASGSWRTPEERAGREKKNQPADCCRRVTNRHSVRVKTIWRWAVEEELIPAHLHDALLRVKGLPLGAARESDAVLPVPEDDLAATIPQLGFVVKDIVQVQLLCGGRPSEVLGLKPADFIRTGTVQLSPTFRLPLGKVWAVNLAKHKTRYRGHSRFLLFGPQAQALLKPYLDRDPKKLIFSAMESWMAFLDSQDRHHNAERGPQPGETFPIDSYRNAINRACDRAGVPSWSPHRLRHNAATRIAEQFGWDVARIVLGQRSLDVTRIYALDNLSKAVDAMERMG